MAIKMLPLILFLNIQLVLPFAVATDFNFPAVFNFGDSNSDSGDLVAGLGIRLGPPNGQTYFKMPNGRFCDGRLIVDFLGKYLSLLTSFLSKFYYYDFYASATTAHDFSTLWDGCFLYLTIDSSENVKCRSDFVADWYLLTGKRFVYSFVAQEELSFM